VICRSAINPLNEIQQRLSQNDTIVVLCFIFIIVGFDLALFRHVWRRDISLISQHSLCPLANGVVHLGKLPAGTRLEKGDSLQNCHQDRLLMQSNGNLVRFFFLHVEILRE
jgi:hypothetical protein